MIPRPLQLLLFAVTFFVCGTVVLAQKLPKKTGSEPENRTTTTRPTGHPRKPRITTPVSAKTPVSVESNNFLLLGDRFRDQEKWNAAAAAYKEAVNVWSGNSDALLELGYLYLDRNRIDEAQQTYSKLRSVNASYASDLLAEINKYKNTLAH